MKRLLFYLILIALACSPTLAQGVIKFQEINYDFGAIPEEGGYAEHRFEFKNTGDKPVIIRTVGTSCGCTASNWSREPVKPGEKGFVVAQYNPRGRPGAFSKSLTVRSNSEPETVTLFIRGTVTPRPKSVEEEFSYRVDNLGLSLSYLGFNRVLNDEVGEISFEIYNFGAQSLFMEFKRVPSYIETPGKMVKIKKGERKKVTVKAIGSKIKEWGYTSDKIICRVNGQEFPINLGITLEENFRSLPEAQRSNPPEFTIDTYSHDFDNAKRGDKIVARFTITNRGRGPLLIRRILPNSNAMHTDFASSPIKPGESRLLTVTLHTEDLFGRQYQDLTLITNDPHHQYVRLRLRGQIDNPNFNNPNESGRPRVPQQKYNQ